MDIMQQGLDLDLPESNIVAIGLGIVSGTTTMDALQRQADRLERNALGEELEHPLNWQTMELEELRALAAQKRSRSRTRPHAGGYPKPKAQPATGTHSTENYQQNQAIFDQQALQHQDNQDDDNQSAVTYEDNQADKPDWDGTY